MADYYAYCVENIQSIVMVIVKSVIVVVTVMLHSTMGTFCFPKTYYDIIHDAKYNYIRQVITNRDDYFTEIYEEWVDTFDLRDIEQNKLYDKYANYIKTYYTTQYIVWDLLKKKG